MTFCSSHSIQLPRCVSVHPRGTTVSFVAQSTTSDGPLLAGCLCEGSSFDLAHASLTDWQMVPFKLICSIWMVSCWHLTEMTTVWKDLLIPVVKRTGHKQYASEATEGKRRNWSWTWYWGYNYYLGKHLVAPVQGQRHYGELLTESQ